MEANKSASNLTNLKTSSKGNILAEKEKEKDGLKRRIIAEDPEWNLAPVQKLTNLCIQIIVKNFERKYS